MNSESLIAVSSLHVEFLGIGAFWIVVLFDMKYMSEARSDV